MISRRNFLKASGILTLGLGLKVPENAYGKIYDERGEYFFDAIQATPELYHKGLSCILLIQNLSNHTLKEIPLPFMPHTIVSGKRTGEAYLTERDGLHLMKINYHSGKILKSYKYEKDCLVFFKGHAALNDAKDLLFTSEIFWTGKIDSRCMDGIVKIRHPDTLEVIEEFSSYGKDPHDFLLQNEKIIICNSSVKNPSWQETPLFMEKEFRNVSIINLRTKKLEQQIAMPDKSIAPGHIKECSDGYLIGATIGFENHQVIQGAYDELQKILPTKECRPVFLTKDFRPTLLPFTTGPRNKYASEFLSIAVNEKFGIIAITNPESNVVLTWDLKDKRFIREIPMDYPKTISNYSDDSFIINGSNKSFILSLINFEIEEYKWSPYDSKLLMSHTYLFN